MVAGPGTATVNFNFNQYSTKDDIKNAIDALPRITGNSGNDVAGAMVLIRDSLFQSCPLRTNSQCVALILYDDGADNTTAVTAVAQVTENH